MIEMIQLYKDNCKNFSFDDIAINRVVGINLKYIIQDPKNRHISMNTYLYEGKKYRGSAYSSNVVTFIINHTEIWKNFPKRELSCSLNSIHDTITGFKYRVIPFDNAKWGVSNDKDILNKIREDVKYFQDEKYKKFNTNPKEFLDYLKENESEFLQKIQPTQMGCKSVFTNELNQFNEELEIWTDSTCILINHNFLDEFKKMI